MSLVTVVVISFNHEQFIRSTIESVLSQNHKCIELIVVDNGSTDNSVSIIKEYKDVKLILNPANGISKAINIALDLAKGEYFIPIASDDVMVFDRISVQLSALKARNDEYIGCFGSMLCIDQDGNLHKKNLTTTDTRDDWCFEEVFTKRIRLYSPTQMYHTQAVRDIGGFDEDCKIEDMAFYFKALAMGKKFLSINRILTFYRIHGSNTHTKLSYMLQNKLYILEKYKDAPFYKKGRDLAYLEAFSAAGSYNKVLAIKLFAKIYTRVDSKYFYLGLLRFILDWRSL